MREAIFPVVLICLLAPACDGAPDPPPLVQVDIGIHVVSLQVPDGWVHLDHGKEHRFQRELAHIYAADLGPVTREGYLRELRHAYRLFRDHHYDDARAHLAGLNLSPAFPDDHLRKRFFQAWHKAKDGGRSDDITHADAMDAWAFILKEVERLPDLDLAELVEVRFPDIETAAHREIAEQQPLTIDGRPALRVEAWDRLSHDHRQSFLFVRNDGNLLMLRMGIGKHAELKPAFEAIAGSLTFHLGSTTS